MINRLILLSFMILTLSCSIGYSTDSLREQELSPSQVSKSQLDYLNEKIINNRKKFLNKTFTSNELMIDLMGPYDQNARIIQNAHGEIETRYIVLEGWSCTFRQTGYGICPSLSPIKQERLKRLDGKGYAKENSDGSNTLGRVYLDSLNEFDSLSRELKTDLQEAQRQRRPEGLRDKDFTSKTKVEKKPTPEDLARIEQAKKSQRLNQLGQLQAQFNQFPIHLFKGEEVERNIKTLNKGFELLSKNIENEEAFNVFLNNVREKLAKIKIEADKALHSVYSQQSFLSTVPPLTLEETKGIQKEIKVQAQQQIDAQETKEQSRLERPNASPIATIEDDEGRTEEKEEKTSYYVFSTIPKHEIIQVLQQTSTEDSSYSGIKINRERLQNFVQFLQNEEREKRRNEGEQLQDSDDFGYYFDSAQGKGSHLKLKFGRGIKSITLSRQGGNFLTVEQLRDIKNALILKGLVTLKK